jgi:shikimate dehydrogenase
MSCWRSDEVTVTVKTQVCGVIGDPVEHTLSPTIHNTAFVHMHLDFVFLAFRVKPKALEDAVRGMRSLGIRGLNVTMPHKSTVTKFLDEVDPTVKLLNAANTILNKEGKLVGYNTDGIGALKALTDTGMKLDGKKVLLLGAGGAAKAIAFSLADEVEELVILNRSAKKARILAENIGRTHHSKVVGNLLSSAQIKKRVKDCDILINATSVGMAPKIDQSLVELQWLKRNLWVMDIVYNPLETKLIKNAKAVGARVITGVEMLLNQGAASFEIWTNIPAPIEVMKKAALNKLQTRSDVG